MSGDWIFKKEVQKGRNKPNIMISKTKNEIDGACGMYGWGGGRWIQHSGVKAWR